MDENKPRYKVTVKPCIITRGAIICVSIVDTTTDMFDGVVWTKTAQTPGERDRFIKQANDEIQTYLGFLDA